MARNASRRLTVTFIVILWTNQFPTTHGNLHLPVKTDNQWFSNLSNTSQRTPGDQLGIAPTQVSKTDDFQSEAEHWSATNDSTGEEWVLSEINTMASNIGKSSYDNLTNAPFLDINSSECGSSHQSGLTGKLCFMHFLVPSLGNHNNRSSSRVRQISSKVMHSFLDRKLPSNLDKFDNLSTFTELKNWHEHVEGMNNTTTDNKQSNRDTRNQLFEVKDVGLQHLENTSVAGSINMTTRGLDEEEEQSLVYTCANRCGQESLFPCSCGALCVVYDTCCEKFYQDCPHIVQDARSRFGDLISSSKICKSDLFLISSCPSQSEPQAHGMDTDDLGRTDLGKEVVSEASAIVRFQHTTKAGPLTTSVTMKSPLESMARRLMNAALGAPVTDASSGITYTNKTIYECHTHKEDKFFVWSLQLNYVYANPQSLEDLKYLKDLDSYEPPFNSAVLSRHFCMANLVETCPATWHPQKGEEHFDTKCSEFFSLTSLSGIAYLLYRNRFCAYCNEGKNQTFVLRDSVSTAPRGYQLRMVMTINQLGHYSIKVMHPDFVEDIIVPWSTVSCKLVSKSSQDLVQGKLSSISSDDRSVCSVKCSSSVFTLSQDGYCKGPGLAQVAVSDDGLPPLCPVVLQHLATFISCGLQSMIKSMPHAEFQRPVISVQTDTKTLKSLYIVELAVHTPMQYRNFFASTDEEGITNWRHLEVLAKSLKHYRRSHDLCTASDSSKDKSNRKQVTPLPFEERLGTSQSMNKSFNLLEERVGPVVDTHNVTTLCMTAINSPQYYEDAVLICRKAVVYTQDADAIADFLDSPCFSHLEKMRLERNTGRNILNNTEGSLHKIWILVAGVAVVVVAKRQD